MFVCLEQSGTEQSKTVSLVKCGWGISSFFPVNTGVRQLCVLAPPLFNTCLGWILGRVVDQSHCRASVSNTEIMDLTTALSVPVQTDEDSELQVDGDPFPTL